MLNPVGFGVNPQQSQLTLNNAAGANLLLTGSLTASPAGLSNFSLPAQASSIPSLMSASQIAPAQMASPSASPGLTMDFQDIGISTQLLQPLLKQLRSDDAQIFNQLQTQKLQILQGITTLSADKQSQAMSLFMQAKSLQTEMLKTYLGSATNAATQSALPMPQVVPNLSMDFQAEGVSSDRLQTALNALNPQDAALFNNLQMQKLQIANGMSTLASDKQSMALQLFQQAKDLQANLIKPYLTNLVNRFVPMASAQNASPAGGGGNSSLMGLAMALLGGGSSSSSTTTKKTSGSSSSSATETQMGGTGNDTLTPTKANAWLSGLEGNDTYNLGLFNNARIVEDAGQGTDTVQVEASYTLGENLENLVLQGTGNFNGDGNELNNVLTGNDGNNKLSGFDGNDTLNGGSGNNTLDGGSGNDTFIINSLTNTLVELANGGTDTVQSGVDFTLAANFENLTLTGTAINGTGNSANNVMTGNAGNNLLSGAEGNDTLNGGNGNDTLLGGAGSDEYRVVKGNTGNVTVRDLNNDGSTDILNLSGYTLADVTVTTPNSTDLVLTLSDGRSVTIEQYFGASSTAGTGHMEQIKLGDATLALGDITTMLQSGRTINGTANDDTLRGEAGNDVIRAGDGNDSVNGREGHDSITGDAGNDTLSGQYGHDSLDGGAGADSLDGGEGNDSLTGGDGNDVMLGQNGDDTLDGGNGDDTMTGGLGNDNYTVNSTADQVVEAANGGTDTVNSTLSYTLGDNLENLNLQGTAANGTGNALNNVITGNSQNNVIDGGSGNDTLSGAGGNDTLKGGDGNDTFQVASTETGNVVINETSGTDTLNLNGYTRSNLTGIVTQNDTDLVLTLTGGRTVTLQNYFNATGQAGTGNVEAIKFQDGQLALADVQTLLSQDRQTQGTTGNDVINGENGNDSLSGLAGNDQLNGKAGNDSLDGGQGADTMKGGVGNDTYTVDNAGDSVVENANEGIDNVNASISYTLTDNVENLTLSGAGNINGSGNALDNVITGTTGDNLLSGGQGNDTLKGLGGNDTLQGGEGNDNYDVSAAGNLVINDTSGDNDRLNLSIYNSTDLNASSTNDTDLILTAQDGKTITIQNYFDGNGGAGAGHIETIQLANTSLRLSDIQAMPRTVQGTAQNDSLHGEGGNDTIEGNDGDDTLAGRGGNDTLKGGLGNDTYTGYGADTGVDEIIDDGGDDDTLDLSSFDASAVTMTSANGTDLSVDLGLGRQVVIRNYFDADHNATQGTIEKLTFQNSTLNFGDIKNTLFPAPPPVETPPPADDPAPVTDPPAGPPADDPAPVTDPPAEDPAPVNDPPADPPANDPIEGDPGNDTPPTGDTPPADTPDAGQPDDGNPPDDDNDPLLDDPV